MRKAFALIATFILAATLHAQTYRSQIGIKVFASFSDAYAWGSANLNPEQFAAANIKPAQSFGSAPFSYPPKAYSMLLIWPLADGDNSDASVQGVEQPLARRNTIDPQIPTCFAFLSTTEWITDASAYTKGAAYTAWSQLTDLQRTGADLSMDVYDWVTIPTQNIHYRRQRSACF